MKLVLSLWNRRTQKIYISTIAMKSKSAAVIWNYHLAKAIAEGKATRLANLQAEREEEKKTIKNTNDPLDNLKEAIEREKKSGFRTRS